MNTAAEKLMLLGGRAVCALIVAHFKLRRAMAPETIDAEELRRTAETLSGMAWDIERKKA